MCLRSKLLRSNLQLQQTPNGAAERIVSRLFVCFGLWIQLVNATQ